MSVKKQTCFKAAWDHVKTIINLCLNIFITGLFLLDPFPFPLPFPNQSQTMCIKFWVVAQD